MTKKKQATISSPFYSFIPFSMYDPAKISLLIYNSLYHTNEGLKSGRLDGAERSLEEAKTGLTKRGTRESGRILIGGDDKKQLIILDGRHLLQAYHLLKKPIPSDMLAFESADAYTLFTSLYIL